MCFQAEDAWSVSLPEHQEPHTCLTRSRCRPEYIENVTLTLWIGTRAESTVHLRAENVTELPGAGFSREAISYLEIPELVILFFCRINSRQLRVN